MILNVDGSALTNLGKVGFGGLVCNHDGTFQFGLYECRFVQYSPCEKLHEMIK
jgi:hypothetical protein